jgi:hypothetical protein
MRAKIEYVGICIIVKLMSNWSAWKTYTRNRKENKLH